MSRFSLILEQSDVAQVFDLFEGYQKNSIFVVGGSIRAALLNREITDIDFATSLEPKTITKILNKEKELVGEVTSGSISPYTKKAIGMGYVSYNENTISEKIYIEIRSKKVEAQIVKRPFI